MSRDHRLRAGLVGLAVLLAALTVAPQASASIAHWVPVQSAPSAEDLGGPLGNGKLVVQAGGGLSLWRPGASALQPFARQPGGYSTGFGSESYLDVSTNRRLRYANCSFGKQNIYAVEPANNTVVRITRKGAASSFAPIPAGFPDGIIFDTGGKFGYRLLVTVRSGNGSITLVGYDCRGRMRVFGTNLPTLEGGIQIAPFGFGRFGGQLIVADEVGGKIYAFSPKGKSTLLVNSGLPSGGDVGVESLGFFPETAAAFPTAYVASAQGALGNLEGANAILSISPSGLRKTGLRPGDLLAASETAGTSIRVRCRTTCSATQVADGPAAAHVEGHIIFVAPSG